MASAAVPSLVTINTTMGTFVVELYPKQAPKTCQNFTELARRGYYDGIIFHRIIADFMAQCGDPTGTGRGGESIFPGGKFADEITRELKHTGAGILSMANAGPNTNGSQFFITLAPCPHLDGKHTIFGRIADGMATVKRLGLARTDGNDRPMDPIRIISARPGGAGDGTVAVRPS
uniref:Peptidyl-prolyl cis-trans isomerase n=1 Tax=Haptolina brevifila TaxID=156173 RepID=A0A7S2FR66_9EUKA|mmetsp:Transcript_17720/g.35746  ORF Transcript_17720/g.35746 Transcript_17720/m.35746 type:complete len:175 (+) Transcript_17720:19-543(+)